MFLCNFHYFIFYDIYDIEYINLIDFNKYDLMDKIYEGRTKTTDFQNLDSENIVHLIPSSETPNHYNGDEDENDMQNNMPQGMPMQCAQQ